MTTFSKIWDTEVKQLAKACVTEPKLVRLMSQGEGYEPSQDEKEYLESISAKYKDIYGMYYISDMIWKVEHALADGRKAEACLAIAQVYEVLNGPSYFQNLFLGNENDEEWKTRAALRDGLYKLMYA
ncbi:MAG: hypothetical protein J6C46_02965 [Clostridia bacterium]|nr:hypothetical protein [Clostridia bacterium]